jgi:hypothetical protein
LINVFDKRILLTSLINVFGKRLWETSLTNVFEKVLRLQESIHRRKQVRNIGLLDLLKKRFPVEGNSRRPMWLDLHLYLIGNLFLIFNKKKVESTFNALHLIRFFTKHEPNYPKKYLCLKLSFAYCDKIKLWLEVMTLSVASSIC